MPHFHSDKQSQNPKRQAEETPFFETKKIKMDFKPLMITYSWPIVVYNESNNFCIEKLVAFQPVKMAHLYSTIQPLVSSKRKVEMLPTPAAQRMKMLTYSHPADEPADPEIITFANISSYKYKIVSPKPNLKCLSSPRLNGMRKVTKRSYKAPKYEEWPRSGVKRSFLDFLECLSYEEMQDVTVEESYNSILDLPVIVTKPVSKKPRLSSSFLIKSETILTERRLSQSLRDEVEFISHF